MQEICELLSIEPIFPTIGSSIPSIFFTEIASRMGIPTSGTMPMIAKRIVETTHLKWKVEYASEHQPSGGGGTVTTLGLLALLNAVKVWKGDTNISDVIIAENEEWRPPQNWEELRAVCEREDYSRLQRPGASEFRIAILEAYDFRCAITSAISANVLEAAHIVPYFGPESDVVPNGIALRVDIHRLFDLGLIGITYDPHNNKFKTYVHDDIFTDYGYLHGSTVRTPMESEFLPSLKALEINSQRHRSLWV